MVRTGSQAHDGHHALLAEITYAHRNSTHHPVSADAIRPSARALQSRSRRIDEARAQPERDHEGMAWPREGEPRAWTRPCQDFARETVAPPQFIRRTGLETSETRQNRRVPHLRSIHRKLLLC